jgi:hypothetical protein
MTLNIMTLSIMPSVEFCYSYPEYRYAECRYAEYHYAECHVAVSNLSFKTLATLY